MKFSYSWLKDYIPGLPQKNKVVDALNLYSFEAEEAEGDTIEIMLPPNRYDASGHIGVAREIAASQHMPLRVPKPKKIKRLKQGWFPVKILAPDACTRYVALFIDEVVVQPSPPWMQKRLTACGIRAINNVVDVMNYVMLETGQPLHAFDADKIGAGGTKSEKQKTDKKEKISIYVRRAERGEKITTLDNQEISLDERILIIADNRGPLALAGIKGGTRAEVDARTKKIVVESAHFDSAVTYAASRQISIRTDASDRFSRGISPTGCVAAAERAHELLRKIGAAKTAVGITHMGKKKSSSEQLNIPINWFQSFLGFTVDPQKALRALLSLGFKARYFKNGAIKTPRGSAAVSSLFVIAPPWRLDIEHKEDVAEEIARMWGYNTIPSHAPRIVIGERRNPDDLAKETIRDTLVSLGMSESYNYSFVRSMQEKNLGPVRPPALENPLNESFAHLRTGLSAGLIKNSFDSLRFAEGVRMFEIGTVWPARTNTPPSQKDTNETTALGIIICRKIKNAKTLFYELKGVVEELLERNNVSDVALREPSKKGSLIEGQRAQICVSGNHVGDLGIVAHNILECPAAYAEINLTKLLPLIEEGREYKIIPRFPSIQRDISMYVKPSVRVSDIEETIYRADVRLINDIDLLDMYENIEDAEAQKSLTFRIAFQADDRTLSDEEVNREMEKITTVLEEKLGAEIR